MLWMAKSSTGRDHLAMGDDEEIGHWTLCGLDTARMSEPEPAPIDTELEGVCQSCLNAWHVAEQFVDYLHDEVGWELE